MCNWYRYTNIITITYHIYHYIVSENSENAGEGTYQLVDPEAIMLLDFRSLIRSIRFYHPWFLAIQLFLTSPQYWRSNQPPSVSCRSVLNQLAYNWRILIYIKDEFEFSKKEHDWPLRSKDNMLVENSIPPCEILMFFESWLLQCDPALCNYRSKCVEKLAFYQTAPAESSRMLPCEVCKTWRILFLSKSMGFAKKTASVKCIDPAINKNPNKSTIKVITSSKIQKPTNQPDQTSENLGPIHIFCLPL